MGKITAIDEGDVLERAKECFECNDLTDLSVERIR